MEVRIISLEALTVVGWKYRGRINTPNQILQLWDNVFLPRMHEIQNRIEPDIAYGVMGNYDPQTGEFDYLAAARVSKTGDLLPGMDSWEIPAQTYAAYPCTLADLPKAYDYLYNTWLPVYEYEHAESPELEYYGVEFTTQPDPAKAIMYLYIPIKPKAG